MADFFFLNHAIMFISEALESEIAQMNKIKYNFTGKIPDFRINIFE